MRSFQGRPDVVVRVLIEWIEIETHRAREEDGVLGKGGREGEREGEEIRNLIRLLLAREAPSISLPPSLSPPLPTCGIMLNLLLKTSVPISLVFNPSTSIEPLSASTNRRRARRREDLPAPVRPTMPIRSPGRMSKERFLWCEI